MRRTQAYAGPESATPQDLASTITRELEVWSSLVDEYKLTAD